MVFPTKNELAASLYVEQLQVDVVAIHARIKYIQITTFKLVFSEEAANEKCRKNIVYRTQAVAL